jgi:YVTN family beta-propeller protein
VLLCGVYVSARPVLSRKLLPANWRSHLRLTVTLILLAAAATCEVMRERRPTILRPGVHLYAYVANGGDGTVTVVDLVSLAPVATISVGPEPLSIAAQPKRKEIWGVSAGGGYAWVIDAPTGRVDRISVCGDPVHLVFSPDAKRAYVACGSGGVVAIDCATRRVVARERTAPRGGTSAVAAAPNGKWVLAANREEASVSLLDAASLKTLATLPAAPDPNSVVVLPDSSKAFVGSATTDFIAVLRLDPPALVTRLATGGRTNSLVLKPDGGEVYVLSPDTHGLTVIDTWTNEVGDYLQLGANPTAGVVAHDGSLLYACDAGGSRVAVVNLAYRELLGSAPTGTHPVACALGLEEKMLLVADRDSNDLAVIAREGPHLVTLVPVGKQPDSLAIKLF